MSITDIKVSSNESSTVGVYFNKNISFDQNSFGKMICFLDLEVTGLSSSTDTYGLFFSEGIIFQYNLINVQTQLFGSNFFIFYFQNCVF